MLYIYLFTTMVLTQMENTPLDSVDFAKSDNRHLWHQHPVWGEPSFDTFERFPGNPVHRGTPPYDWPVNGFLFEDPPTGHWYLYVGHYLQGYKLDESLPSQCTVYRSVDRGQHWESLGPIMEAGVHVYEEEVSPVYHAPDVSVVYEDGLYHLCFDWTTKNTSWANAANPDKDSNSGVGYAWATRPEGPFQLTLRPIADTRTQEPLLGKYRRLYASSLIRRSNDWLVLTLTDSGPYFGWALLGMTSAHAAGPYTPPSLLLHPESDRYHPPLLEFFPAFVHENHVYMPATSVALNRNFQCMFRAPVEDAHKAEAWELYQHGSLWHAMPVEHETYGLWGQAFSGFVDGQGVLNVMFPSRDENNRGTINLAKRLWAEPFREQGFIVSAHGGPTLIRTKIGGQPQRIDAQMKIHGTAALVWNMQGPMGADAPRSDATLHPRMTHSCHMLEIGPELWRILAVDDKGQEQDIASGKFSAANQPFALLLDWNNAQCTLSINDSTLWEGTVPGGNGAFGLFLPEFCWAEVDSFAVQGTLEPVSTTMLYTEALLGAAQGFVNWEQVESPLFKYGEGAVAKSGGDSICAKWNFAGNAFHLWAPTGPNYGRAEVFLNGVSIGELDFHSSENEQSRVLMTRTGLSGRYQALTLRPLRGTSIPLDFLEVLEIADL